MDCKVIKKRFFSSVKENIWLNGLGQKGYLLLEKNENSYTFELTEKTLYYSVEWLDCAHDSEEILPYIAAYAAEHVQIAATYSLWAYFISEQPIEKPDEAYRRNSVHYRNTALILYALDAVVAALIGYQFAIRSFLETNKVFFEAPELEKSNNIVLNLAYRLLYGAERLVYFYSEFCSDLFGETKAALALGILIPLAIVLSVTGALWVSEWLKNIPPKKEEIVDVYQESEVSGKTQDDC